MKALLAPLAAAVALALLAARPSASPRSAPGQVWTHDAVIVGNQSFLHVHNISELVAASKGGALGATFRVPWLLGLRSLRGLRGLQHRDHAKHRGRPLHGKPANASAPSMRQPNPDSILGYDIPCGVRNVDESNRIVGGSEAQPGEFPWQVSLQKRRWLSLQHICGGAIVAPFWVVTAGHCVEGVKAKDLSVVAGDHDLYKVEGKEQRRKVVRIVSLGYDANTFANDISLLQLDKRLRFDAASVAPICVPKPQHHYRDVEAVVSGWGKLAESGGLPARLQQVSLPLIPWETCTKRYRSRGFNRYLHTCQICSGRDQGGQDSCQGDSGGPLICEEEDGRYYLCGVVSWGIGCARAEFPGVYTEVSCYARWINEVLYNEHHYLDPENEKKKENDDEEEEAGATPGRGDSAAAAAAASAEQ